MKKMKKIAASLLALVMVAAMMVPAMAESVTVKNSKPDEHTFRAYQIFTAEPSTDADGNKDGGLNINSVMWGSAVTNPGAFWDAIEPLLKADVEGNRPAKPDPFTAQAVARILNDNFDEEGGTDKVYAGNKALAQAIYGVVSKSPSTLVEGGDGTPMSTGYYLVTDSTDGEETVAEYMLWNVVSNTTIYPKTSTTIVKKEVLDKFGDKQYKDAAIYGDTTAGNEVEFKITVDLPSNLNKYPDSQPYNLTLTDTMSKGLTYVEGSMAIKLVKGENEQAITAAPVVNGQVFTLAINGLQAYPTYASGIVEITYKAVFNAETETGATGNKNTVELDVDGTKYTDDADVYTLEVIVNKKNAANQPLSGAKFALLKAEDLPEGGIDAVWDKVNHKLVDNADTSKFITLTENGETAVHTTDKPLAAGTYYLIETAAPGGGYTPVDPMQVTITASVNPQTGLSVTLDNSKFETDGNKNVTTTVVNRIGTLLPQTGGMGTTLFYIGGAVLAIGAVVLLITKRRVGDADDE